uniref:Cytochrome P450 n=1 Tax=Kalanchoe fedtschenkoi TaxID=63787 RepID=A0A7N0TRN8_KALFE
MNHNQPRPFHLPESIPNQPRKTRKCTHQQLNFMPSSPSTSPTIFFNKQSMTTMFSAAVDKLSPCTYVTLAIFFILVFVVKTKPRRSSGRHKLPPGPKPWPFVGCLPELVRNKPTFRWIHGLMKEMKTEILCVKLAQTHLIVVSSPEISREVLKTQDAKFASRPSTAATRIITRGYLATALVPLGHQWRKMRKIMTSELLSPTRMRWTYGKRVEELNHIVRYVHDQAKSPVDIRSLARGYMVNVIRRLVFRRRGLGGPKGSGLMGPQEVEHAEALFTIHAHLFAFCVGDYTHFLSFLDLEGHKKAIRDANATVDKYHDPIIHSRVAQIRSGSHTEADDLLHLLIMLKDAEGMPLLSLEEIKAQVTDLMLASVDNPASSVEWAFAELIDTQKSCGRNRQGGW